MHSERSLEWLCYVCTVVRETEVFSEVPECVWWTRTGADAEWDSLYSVRRWLTLRHLGKVCYTCGLLVLCRIFVVLVRLVLIAKIMRVYVSVVARHGYSASPDEWRPQKKSRKRGLHSLNRTCWGLHWPGNMNRRVHRNMVLKKTNRDGLWWRLRLHGNTNVRVYNK